jgi:ACR3 family arsenite efflux pump ArsB
MILTKAPAMLYAAVRHRNRSIFVLALDLMVPPLSLLALLLFVTLIFSSALALIGMRPYAVIVSATSMLLVFLAFVMACVNVAALFCRFGHSRSFPPT